MVDKLEVRGVEEAVAKAVSHRTRVEVLGYLNEGPRSPKELARLIGVPLSRIDHHIKELLAWGSIELARTERVRNTTEHFYRATVIPYFDDEEMWEMPGGHPAGGLRADPAVRHGRSPRLLLGAQDVHRPARVSGWRGGGSTWTPKGARNSPMRWPRTGGG